MLKSESLWPTVRSQSISSLCGTCLADDRQLFSLQKTPQFVNICSGLALPKTGMVCFECRARLSSFVKFRNRALQANKMLSCISPRCRTPVPKISGIQCLSTLTRTIISPYDNIYIDGDALQVKIEVSDPELEVKEEMPQLIVTVEPLMKPTFTQMDERLKSETNNIIDIDSTTEAKLKLRDDDDDNGSMKSDTASEDGERQQRVHDPNIAEHFAAKQMQLSEVLAHLERRRNATRYKRAQYKCHKCAQTFTSEAQHGAHAKLHDEERGSFKCEVCERSYKDRKRLKSHAAAHYTRYACRHCSRSCFSYKQMYFHYRNVHDEQTPRQCGKCPARFTTKRELKQHMHRAHGRKYPCPSCDRQYATSVGLQRHSLVHDATVPELECDVCHKKYKGESNLKVHVQGVHQGGAGSDAYCTECDMRFKTQSQYRRHLASGRHVPVEDYQFECDYCGQRCVQKMTLRTHIEQMHLRLARYKCPVCQESFHTSWVLLRHKRLKHTDLPPKKPHACYICEKIFRMRKSLDEHMNTHLGVRPFECKLCGATFVYSAALYNHNRLVHLKKKRLKKSTS